MKMNGIATGNVVRNTHRNTPSAPSQSSLRKPRAGRRLGQLNQRLAHGLEFRGAERGGDHRRQRVGNEAVRLLRGGGLAHGPQRADAAPLFAQAAHEIQDAVNDAPGQVAAERADEHGADIVAARLGDTERAGEGEDHDQAKEHFGDALVRFEHALGGFDGFVRHRRA